ncbi:MAG: helix-turn-helix transcriptional regulator [Muribaculaceae bacterium]
MTETKNSENTQSTVAERLRLLIVTMRKSQVEFAKLIGVDPGNLSKMLAGRTRLSSKMLDRIASNTGCSLQWLMYGTDVPFPRETENVTVLEHGGEKTCMPEGRSGAPVYDIDVTAGAEPLAREFTNDRIIGWLNMPNLSAATPIVRVSGDSMVPRIQNGSFIQIRPVSLDSPLYWGATYVIVLDDYRMVKVVRRNPDPSMVTLHSINTEYDDMEIDRSLIRGLFIVQSVFNFDVLS